MNDISTIISQYNDMIYVEVNVTNACNQKCYYCCFRHQDNIKFINLNMLKNFLLNLYQTTNKHIIVEIIGGEPTLLDKAELKQFSNDLAIVYPYINIMLFSNFSAHVELYNFLLKNHFTLFLTWHSLINDRTNQLFIAKSQKLIKPCYIYVMFENRYDRESLKAYEMLIKTNNYISLCELTYDRKSNKISNLNELYSNEQIKTFQEYKNNEKNNICNLKTNHVIIRKNNIDIDCIADEIDNRNFKNYICSAGKTYIFIQQDGNIYSCRKYIDKPIGNIKQKINNIKFKPTLCIFDNCPTIVKTNKQKIFH